eukprot:CAMPEP_0116887888 /NCGR_PEP_ID=MMETSP0463-20121206/22596_1 /TAXON_ID=181622 /ORGANISM="Strombidinopsis sp, Strain SopsisLIS2011" /LENGTH=65 /DNA_ID=CAMNT_0004551475 /DNA_START=390 /DNA_END=587 /DNA_ORIENTATION=-
MKSVNQDAFANEIEPKKAASGNKKWKKVRKSRVFTDAKGYMVTEDYSSYEEVDDVNVKKQQKIPS